MYKASGCKAAGGNPGDPRLWGVHPLGTPWGSTPPASPNFRGLPAGSVFPWPPGGFRGLGGALPPANPNFRGLPAVVVVISAVLILVVLALLVVLVLVVLVLVVLVLVVLVLVF